MSAYMVDRNHVRYLVSAMVSQGIIRPDKACEVGQLLWDSNRRSIETRYPGTVGTDEHFREHAPCVTEETYRYDSHEPWPVTCCPVQVVKSCKCFDYQACESPEWGDSLAAALVLQCEDFFTCLAGPEFSLWRASHRQGWEKGQAADAQFPLCFGAYEAAAWGAPEPPTVATKTPPQLPRDFIF